MSGSSQPVPIHRVRQVRQACETPGCDRPGRHVSPIEERWGESRVRCMACCNAIEDAEEALRLALVTGRAED